MKRTLWIALAAVFFLSLSPAISASPVCGDRAKVIDSLAAKYAEEPVAVGVTPGDVPSGKRRSVAGHRAGSGIAR
jgi:hypothetical protein